MPGKFPPGSREDWDAYNRAFGGPPLPSLSNTYWRSRTDPRLIASIWKETADGIELLELGGDDPQGALTYWHERPKQAPRTWRFKTEAELRQGWERVERGWIAVEP